MSDDPSPSDSHHQRILKYDNLKRVAQQQQNKALQKKRREERKRKKDKKKEEKLNKAFNDCKADWDSVPDQETAKLIVRLGYEEAHKRGYI